MPQELSSSERVACEVVHRVLDVEVEPWDVAGRQRAVDAVLHYPDGRTGALEVTALAADRAHQLDRHVDDEALSWPLPGRWLWTVALGDVRELRRLRTAFPAVALWCEEHGIDRPELWWRVANEATVPEDVAWAADSPHVTMNANPDAPSVTGDGRRRTALLLHQPVASLVDHSLAELHDALLAALEDKHLPAHVEKLLAHPDVDERHLFLVLHLSALNPQISDALSFGGGLPPDPPPLPAGVTHLWLAPHFSRRVLVGTAAGWTEHHPYDN